MTYCAYCDNTGRDYAVPSTPCSECKINETLERALKREEALQQRLNAADQRIDELEELLADAQRSVDYHAGMQREDGGARLYGLLARISAALKPAEAGSDDA